MGDVVIRLDTAIPETPDWTPSGVPFVAPKTGYYWFGMRPGGDAEQIQQGIWFRSGTRERQP